MKQIKTLYSVAYTLNPSKRILDIEYALKLHGFGCMHAEDQINEVLHQLHVAHVQVKTLKAEIENLKPPNVEVGDLVQIVGYGEVNYTLAWFYGELGPHFMQVTRRFKQGAMQCVEVKQPTDLDGTAWKVPISSIVAVKKQTPKVGTYDENGNVYRSSGWQPVSRKIGDRRSDPTDPRAIALSALEAIPHPSTPEWQTAISMARKLRGLSPLEKLQTRSGKDRRTTSKGVDSEA